MPPETARWVVVDDADPAIKYAGLWFEDFGSLDSKGNFGPVYDGTLHGTNSSASLEYSFNGTQVTIYGTNNHLDTSGVLDPAWECFIDGISIGSANLVVTVENNWVLCEQDDLHDGAHMLSVNATTKRQTFWFDSIRYRPSPTMSLESATVLVDNSDVGLQNSYSADWMPLFDIANMTNSAYATFSFNFTGISLAWYGLIPIDSAHPFQYDTTGVYVLDGGTPTTFVLQRLRSDTVTQYNQKFFETPPLLPGPHNIVVTYLGNSATTPLTLDYLIIHNGTMPSRSSTASVDVSATVPSNTPATVPSNMPAIVPTNGRTTVPTNMPAAVTATVLTPPQSHENRIGTLVGVAAASGVIAGSVMVLSYCCWRSKKRRHYLSTLEQSSQRSPRRITKLPANWTHFLSASFFGNIPIFRARPEAAYAIRTGSVNMVDLFGYPLQTTSDSQLYALEHIRSQSPRSDRRHLSPLRPLRNSDIPLPLPRYVAQVSELPPAYTTM
ncbi:hypothetical protein CPC08DRAFT_760934 [Agrocybe pediades]|nr:hypothetical protein CPC08DRAFT_760934 [Agrocybe pediades]